MRNLSHLLSIYCKFAARLPSLGWGMVFCVLVMSCKGIPQEVPIVTTQCAAEQESGKMLVIICSGTRSTRLAEKYQRHHTLSQSLTPTNEQGIHRILTSSLLLLHSLFNFDDVSWEQLNWTY